MKLTKKLLSVLLAMVMVLAMAVPTMAEEPSTTPQPTEYKGELKITINTSNKAMDDSKYEAYQVFTGDLAQDNEGKLILSNIVWGKGVNGDDLLAALTSGSEDKGGIPAFKDCKSAADVAKVLGDAANASRDSEIAQQFAEVAAKHLAVIANSEVMKEGDDSVTIEVEEVGYYLVLNRPNDPDNDTEFSYTRYILEVVGDVTVTAKADVPKSEKKVDDINDSTGAQDGVEWEDSADYDIGDDVPFKLEGTLPTNIADYETYKIVFHDKESAGLTFKPETVEVSVVKNTGLSNMVGATVLTKGVDYEVVTKDLKDGCTFEIIIKDIKSSYSAASAGDIIRVTYSSELNTNAVVGSEGNPNTMHMEFSNNPNAEGEGETGKTPDDTVIVFTYDLDVNKIDEEEKPLTGAEFDLYKEVSPDTKGAVVLDEKGNVKTEGRTEDDKRWVKLTLTKNTEGTIFTFKGLDDGNYKLVETKTPAGYNSIDSVDFTVTATHDVTSDDPKLKTLEGTEGFNFTLSPTVEGKAIGQTNIENLKGSTLPETGGIGTTIFYVVGGILVVGAVILLVTKKRMSKEV